MARMFGHTVGHAVPPPMVGSQVERVPVNRSHQYALGGNLLTSRGIGQWVEVRKLPKLLRMSCPGRRYEQDQNVDCTEESIFTEWDWELERWQATLTALCDFG